MHMVDQAWTIKRLLDWTTEFFREQHLDSARLDAEVLLSEALQCQRIDLYTRFDQVPEESQRMRFRNWVRRRAQGEPVAYLVGHREFFSLNFLVNRHVLIPRPETEHLVVQCLDLMKCTFAKLDQVRIADVGTGSGNIAIAVAKSDGRARVTAIDVHDSALKVARENARLHNVENRISFLQGDLLAGSQAGWPFEIVASNPPYVGRAESDLLPRDVRQHEPPAALFADGPLGIETIVRLVQQAPAALSAGGYLVMEVSPMIAQQTRQLIEDSGEFESARMVRDLAGHLRVVVTRRR